jgi:UDP-N-acetylglucosamine enolpyruvyl transferase
MYDVFPFPTLSATSVEELASQVNNYLIQFKETLEFALTNINTENLSQDLIEQLNTLGADIENNNEEQIDQMSQIAGKTLSVSDVINSDTFKMALDGAVDNIVFTVNFDTGNLEYTKE